MPNREDQNKYVRSLYFGFNSDLLGICIKRAYLDLSRTIRGLREHPNRESLSPDAAKQLKIFLSDLEGIGKINDKTEFDTWHNMICNTLCFCYDTRGFKDFSYGQAQKWLNMTMKYIYVYGDDYLPGYMHVYNFCHMPIDEFILKAIYKKRRSEAKAQLEQV